MANTTNLNLSKLSGTEKLKTFPTPYSDNMDAIDGAFGAGFGVSGKPTVNAEINSLADGLAIISNNNTHAAITAGQFVYVRGHGSLSDGLYVATSNISANGTLSGSNLTADTAGGLNSVYASLNSNKINTSAIKNNLSTTASGCVLDARQGKTLGDYVSNLRSKDTLFSFRSITKNASISCEASKYLLVEMRVSTSSSDAGGSRGKVVLPTSSGAYYVPVNCGTASGWMRVEIDSNGITVLDFSYSSLYASAIGLAKLT